MIFLRLKVQHDYMNARSRAIADGTANEKQNPNMILWNEICCERVALRATINESRLTSREGKKSFGENWEFERGRKTTNDNETREEKKKQFF